MAARGSNTTSNLDPYRVPWFADCAPSLLTNRTIRRYLDAYSQQTWAEVIKLTLISGILGLEQQFPGGALSIQQLRQLVERGGAQLVVERTLPGLQRQILGLQTNLDAVFDKLAVEPPPAPAVRTMQQQRADVHHTAAQPGQQQEPAARRPAQAMPPQRQQQQEVEEVIAPRIQQRSGAQPAQALNPGPVAPKPSDEWRLGEKTGFPSPPRTRDHPLRRSGDNQGATNPIYPDWWLAAGPPAPPAPKQVPHKAPRKQPRLAYSVQQPKAVSPATDDLVTAEYLMVPGSGYGQGEGQPVVAGVSPPVMLTSITADSMHTKPVTDMVQPPAAGAGGGGAAAGALTSKGTGAAAASRGQAGSATHKATRHPRDVQSKSHEAVAASRRRAASQQQRRQQLLASAVAAGSSLFGAAGQQRQQQAVGPSSTAAAEAVAACAPAAAADHFLSNPWTSCFLDPAALKAAQCGYASLPAADITADDEARLAAIMQEEQEEEAEQPPAAQPTAHLRAPAAYAVLQSVVAAGQEEEEEETAAVSSSSAAGTQQREEEAAADLWLQHQQEQLRHHLGSVHSSPGRAQDLQASSVGAGSSSSRGVFADITAALNSQPDSYAVAAYTQQESTSGPDDWQSLPLIEEEEQQQQQPQHQQHHMRQQERQKTAWAADFGHLENVEAPAPRAATRKRRPAGKPHKRWSETWVGDFGHLQEFPRFARETAFQQQQQQQEEDSAATGAAAQSGPSAGGKLFMSPADLQQLVAAADQLRQRSQAAQATSAAAAAAAASAPGGNAEAAAAAAAAADVMVESPAGAASGSAASLGADVPGEQLTSSVQGLAARFAELLSRWDLHDQSGEGAAELPAGVAVSRAAVSHAAPAAAGAGFSAGAAAAAANVSDNTSIMGLAASTSSLAVAGNSETDSDVVVSQLLAGELHSRGGAVGASLSATQADTTALLLDLQQAVFELSSTAAGSDTGSSADVDEAAAAAAAATDAAEAAASEASEAFDAARVGVVEPAAVESHLEGMQEASEMLQQALGRHDALMQLIASLGGAGSDVLLSSTASGSELTQ